MHPTRPIPSYLLFLAPRRDKREGRKGGMAESEGFNALASRVGHLYKPARGIALTHGIDGVPAQVMNVSYLHLLCILFYSILFYFISFYFILLFIID